MLRLTSGVFITVWLLSTIPAFGTTSQVGTCTPTTPQYDSIQEAVNSSAPGDTIQICPNIYNEQVFIGQSLTLQGLELSGAGAGLARVAVPGGGLVLATGFDGAPVAPQIYIFNGANVSITNLTVDGTGNGINTCAVDLIGIYFQNASGTITRSAVLNEALPSGFTGCQSGEGIFAESGNGGSSIVNVSNTYVAGYQKNGITGNEAGTTLTATNNTIVGQGSTTGAAENGIQIAFGAAGTATSNTVADDIWGPDAHNDPGDAASGILVYASKRVIISSNQVTNSQFGIAVVSDPVLGKANATTITQNTVNATHIFDAIDVCSNNNNVSSNTINGADETGIHLDSTCTSSGSNNTVMNNTINLSCAGVLLGTGTTGNTLSSNTYYNVNAQNMAGDSCVLAIPLHPNSLKPSGKPAFKPQRH